MSRAEDLYVRSLSSKNLRAEGRIAGDVDALIAAGWVRDGLATRLYRARAEFDAIKGEWDLLERKYQEQLVAARQEAGSVAVGPTKAPAMYAAAEDEVLRRRAFVLLGMKSLNDARSALSAFVVGMAGRDGLELSADDLARLVGRILDQFLDPLCATCQGVRFKVVQGTGRLSSVVCGHCRGSGRRPLKFGGKTPRREVIFTRFMLAELDRKTEAVSRRMSKFLRERGGL
jgi:hypothetical protein